MEFITAETVSVLIFFIGLYGLMTQKNIIKTIMSLSIMESGVYLFFITTNLSENSTPPIGEGDPAFFADPVPQALMITAIVIGIGVTAIGLTMFVHYKQKYGITNWTRKVADPSRTSDDERSTP